MLEAAEDGQCDGKGGGVWARKKIKSELPVPLERGQKKKEDQDMGVIASGCRIAWHWGHSAGYTVL